MSAKTPIQWTDRTWNPVRGCSRVSPGCDHCYAMGQAHRFSGPGKPYAGLTTIRRGKVDWAGMARLIPSTLAEPLRWKRPQRIFVNSMSDLFHESLSSEEIAEVFAVMAACPQHTFQILTKRPERARKWFEWAEKDDWIALRGAGEAVAGRMGWCHAGEDDWTFPLPNVWLGTSAENQNTWDTRAPHLVQIPAAKRFVSMEPLLERVSLGLQGVAHKSWGVGYRPLSELIHWVIVGGESGRRARIFDFGWALDVVNQCREAGVAPFVKQLGSFPTDGPLRPILKDKSGGDWNEWPSSLRVREFPTP